MKTIYAMSKKAITPDHIPSIESLIEYRRIIKETPQGLRLCAVDAPEGFKGFLYSRKHYDFFETHAELMEEIARRANDTAAQLDAMKLKAVALMCDAHDALRMVHSQ